MKWQVSKNNIILYLMIILLLCYIIVDKGFNKINQKHSTIEIIDTTYKYKIIDSIEYNIIHRDSIITEITYEYENKYIEAEHLNDSSAIELFKELCSDDSLYGGAK